MKLRWGAGSPFVRKVMVSAIETGLDARIEKVPTDYRAADSDLPQQNPLGKVPTLVCDDGRVMIDSPVICAYLDTLHTGAKLIPESGAARWDALHLQSLADGMLDAAIAVQRERGRPDDKQWDEFSARQWTKVERAMDWLDANAARLDGPLTIGQIAMGCALDWIAFRLGDRLGDWQKRWPKVAGWYRGFAARPSMTATVPR
jgi:glutathione S-transferase